MIIRRKCSMCGSEIEEEERYHHCHGDPGDVLLEEERVEEWEDEEER